MPQKLNRPVRNLSVRTYRRLAQLQADHEQDIRLVLADLGLSITEFELLSLMYANSDIAQQDLAATLLFSAPNITYHVQRLAKRGLVTRTEEGRFKRLNLTDSGREVIEKAIPLVVAYHERQFANLTREELQQLNNLLQRARRKT